MWYKVVYSLCGLLEETAHIFCDMPIIRCVTCQSSDDTCYLNKNHCSIPGDYYIFT